MKDTHDASELRRRAEKKLEEAFRRSGDLSGMSPERMASLIHELQVHQIELEMQNDELRRIQGELEHLRDRYVHLYDFSPVGYFTVSEKGSITEANLTAATLLQVERGTLIGNLFSHFILPEDQDVFYLHRRGLIETKKLQSCRLRMIKKDGNEFHANLEFTIVEEEDGGLKQIRIMANDITEQKELENRLHQAQKIAAIGTLAGGIAHNLNNALNPILIHADLVMMILPQDSPLQMNLKEIYKAGEHAVDVVKQILMFSRQKKEERLPLSVKIITKEALKLIRGTLPATIDIRYHEEAKQDTVLADPTQIHEILMNLCTNAAHAMREKGGILEVILSDGHIGPDEVKLNPGLNPGHYLRLAVRDTGSGIPHEFIDKIFEPYFTTKDVGEGTGMGLALVHGIVKSCGGDISVESELGKGTAFRILLPVTEEEVSLSLKKKLEIPKGNERILFVDDENTIVSAIQPMLENLGYEVTSRTSSIEALEAFRNDPEGFDLVITDMTMPSMTGDELAVEVMRIRPDIPVILCTGFNERIDEHKAKAKGIRAYVMKPIGMGEMARKIREVLDKESN